MNTQIVNVPARGTGQKAHVRQEHPGDGLARSNHLDSLPAAPHSLLGSRAAPFPGASTCLVFPSRWQILEQELWGRRAGGQELPGTAFRRHSGVDAPLLRGGGSSATWSGPLTCPLWSQWNGPHCYLESLKWVDLRPRSSLPLSEEEMFSG